ncbi:sel1 repeat family protein [Massilia sp. Dwa41.01b]|nr:tetratricopeptide repeat protein [Massilia sp. Dwa41.01b]QNA89993.1 sel1 repeat family protein [Massilia sp. Dwa41.01b]
MSHTIDVVPVLPSHWFRSSSNLQVAIHGVLDGHDPEQVLVRMAALVKQETAQLRALLDAPGTVVKRGLDRVTAEKYRHTLAQIGCDCRIGSDEAASGSRPRNAWEALQADAQAGHPEAQFQLGMAYAKKAGVAQGDALAAAWIEKAAARTCRRRDRAGRLLSRGLGVPRDEAIALRWARMTAQAGLPEGQYLLGRMLRRGEGTPADKNEAARWLLRSAEQGYAPAQYMVGYDYLTAGRQAPAALWLTRAAEQGEPNAQTCLGVMCLQGDGVAHDPARGIALLSKAAGQGIASAQHNLGRDLRRRKRHRPRPGTGAGLVPQGGGAGLCAVRVRAGHVLPPGTACQPTSRAAMR